MTKRRPMQTTPIQDLCAYIGCGIWLLALAGCAALTLMAFLGI